MPTSVHTLINHNGVEIDFIPQGGKIISIRLPQSSTSEKIDIVVGYATPKEYLSGDPYLGAICGRVANRIAQGKYSYAGKVVQLTQNDGKHHLHGGYRGFNVKNWTINRLSLPSYVSAYHLLLNSPNGEENYPGALQVNVVYALNDNNELLIDIKATTDQPTIVNLTSHPYFNLNGHQEDILNHLLQINANTFTPTDDEMIVTGEIRQVKQTDTDFTTPRLLKDVINQEKKDGLVQYLRNGIDCNWLLNNNNEMTFAAKLYEPSSGRSVELHTTQSGVQIYTALHFDGKAMGKNGLPLVPYSGIAMEAQGVPNAANISHFPSWILHPSETYRQQIIYRFCF